MTGLETAIILVAFVITAAAFSFVVLNMGFLPAQKSQSVISSSMDETASVLQPIDKVIGEFAILGSNGSRSNMTKAILFLKPAPGSEPLDKSYNRLVITYSNPNFHGVIYSAQIQDTVTNITEVSGDGDTLIESGEFFKVEIDFTKIWANRTDCQYGPSTAVPFDAFTHPYESFKISFRPERGAVITVERTLSSVSKKVLELH